MGTPLRVLIIEDSEADAKLLMRELSKGGYEPSFRRVETEDDMNDAIEKQNWDILLSDYVMPHFSGLAALEALKRHNVDIPFIVISGKIGEDVAVEAMKAGANDYILKDNLARLVPAVERELQDAVVRRERRQAQEERDQLAVQLRQVNEELVVSSIKAKGQVEEAQIKAAQVDAVFEAMAESLLFFGPNGDIIRMNPRAEALFGSAEGNLEKTLQENAKLLDLNTKIGRPLTVEESPVRRALRGEVVSGVVMSLRCPADNREAVVSVSSAPIRSSDARVVGGACVLTELAPLGAR